MTCPEEFRENCENDGTHCYKCRADKGSGKLFYKGYVDIGTHPSSISDIEKKARASRGYRSNKEGRKKEKKIIEDLCGRHNRSSIGFDGSINIKDHKLKVEVKTGNRTPFPNKAERTKGKGKIDLYVVEGSEDTWVTMPLSTFELLLELQEIG